MRTRVLALLSTTLFGLGLGVASATAGPCSAEIERLTKVLSAHDAGSGPTAGPSKDASTTSGQGAAGQHAPTQAMSGQGTATSPEDVRRQTQGRPTASQQGQGSSGPDMDGASTALQRARDLDGQGKEADCMAATHEAGRLVEQK